MAAASPKELTAHAQNVPLGYLVNRLLPPGGLAYFFKRLYLGRVETGFFVKRSHVDRINEGENILLEKYPYMCGLGLKDVAQGRDSLTFNQQQIELAFFIPSEVPLNIQTATGKKKKKELEF